MNAGNNTAQDANQADDDTGRTQLDIYAKAATRVVQTIGARDDTHGDPRVFAVIFADMLSAYLRPRLAGASFISEVDALVVLDLMKTARLATGGEYTDHVLDKAGYAILALASILDDDAGDPVREEPDPSKAAEAPIGADGPPGVSPGDDRDNLSYVDDADLLRWALDPEANPFADLMDGNKLRPGATAEMVETRRLRVVELLNSAITKGRDGINARNAALDHYGKPFALVDAA